MPEARESVEQANERPEESPAMFDRTREQNRSSVLRVVTLISGLIIIEFQPEPQAFEFGEFIFCVNGTKSKDGDIDHIQKPRMRSHDMEK